MKFDIVDGGIPAVFLDGPKQGHSGVVTPVDGTPPRYLRFLGGLLIYERHSKRKVDGIDPYDGQPVRFRGVAYRMDPDCHTAQEVRRVDREALIESGEAGTQQ